MNRPFNTHIEGIDIAFWHDLIESHGKLVTLSRNELLCEAGEHSSVLGMVVSGYFKYDFCLNYNNTLQIGGFAFPGALIGNYPDCMRNLPASFNIRAGKKSSALVMDATLLPEIFDNDLEACRHGRLLVEQGYISLRKRYIDIYTKTPAERYHDLIHRHSQIEQVVTQKEIAAYLQITPTHLCRIKKDLLNQ